MTAIRPTSFFWPLHPEVPAMSEELFYNPAVLKVIRAILVSQGIRAEPNLVRRGKVICCGFPRTRRRRTSAAGLCFRARAPGDRAHADWLSPETRRFPDPSSGGDGAGDRNSVPSLARWG